MSGITKGAVTITETIPPLDESLLTLNDLEKEFLHASVTTDEKELKRRILEVQKDAYQDEHAYPCIRVFHFVSLFMAVNLIYSEVLAAGKRGRTVFLDLGCCMGTDVRKLVADGYPAENVLGCDLREVFVDCGYKLFGDKGHCAIHFFESDIFEVPYPFPATTEANHIPPSGVAGVTHLKQLRDRVDHFYAGALFHLFDESTQYALALRVAQLVKRSPGTTIFGRHQGLEEGGYINDHPDRRRYGHSPKSWPLLWKKVFSELESPEFAERVVVEAQLSQSFDAALFITPDSVSMLYWSIKIM